MGLALAGVAAAGAASLFAVLKGGAAEFSDNQKAMAQFEAGLKSTGNVAGISSAQMKNLADSIEAKTGTDGAAVVSGAALLATFTKVRNEVGKGNDVFSRATQAGVDLAARGFGSVESNAVLLGKALNDPIKGLSALGKQGVTFTAAQKDTIAALVKTGDTLGAQKIILKEIEGQVGGSAEAYGKTLPGQLARARAAFDGVKESVFKAVLPAMTGMLNFVTGRLLPGFQSLADRVGPIFGKVGEAAGRMKDLVAGLFDLFANRGFDGTLSDALGVYEDSKIIDILFRIRDAAASMISTFRDAVMPVLQKVGDIIKNNLLPIFAGLAAAFVAFQLAGVITGIAAAVGLLTTAVVGAGGGFAGLAAVVGGLLSPVLLVAVGIGALVAGLVVAYRESEAFREIVGQVVTFLRDTFSKAIADTVAYVEEVWPNIQSAIENVITAVQAIIETFISIVSTAWKTWGDELLALATAAFDFIKDTISNAFDFIKGLFETALALLAGDWSGAWDGIKQVLSAAWDQIKNVIDLGWQAVKALFSAYLSALKLAFTAGWDAIKAVLSAAWDAMKQLVSDGWDAIKRSVSEAFGALGRAFTAGWDGIKRGVGTAWDGLKKVVGDGWDAIKRFTSEALDDLVVGIGKLPERIGKAAVGAFDGLMAAFKSAINFIIRGWNNIEFTLPSVDLGPLGTIGGFTIGTPNIPELASGGIVPAVSGGRLVRVAEGGRDEAVIPLGPGGFDEISQLLRENNELLRALPRQQQLVARAG